jgi:hypothetical protein
MGGLGCHAGFGANTQTCAPQPADKKSQKKKKST